MQDTVDCTSFVSTIISGSGVYIDYGKKIKPLFLRMRNNHVIDTFWVRVTAKVNKQAGWVAVGGLLDV